MSDNIATFTAEEREAMKARAKELAAEARSSKNKAQGEADVMEAIKSMPEPDRSMAMRIHELVKANSDLDPKTWYGMPGYANEEGKIVCFFQAASKFKSRYSAFGFNDSANLDEDGMWPTAFGIIQMTAKEEAKIVELVKKAVS